MTGFFITPRAIWSDPNFRRERFTELQAYLWIVSEAAWAERDHRVGDVILELKRGQVGHSIRFMAQAWEWTDSRVRRFLGRLERRRRIDIDTTQGVTVITVRDYEEMHRTRQAVEERHQLDPTKDRREGDANEKNVKEDLEGNKLSSTGTTHNGDGPDELFDVFWKVYPHRGGAAKGMRAARVAFEHAKKQGAEGADIIAAALAYQRDRQVIAGFAPDPERWLRESRWCDEVEPPRPAQPDRADAETYSQRAERLLSAEGSTMALDDPSLETAERPYNDK